MAELAKVRQIKSMRAQVPSAKKVREATKTSSMKTVATSTGFDSLLNTAGETSEVSEEVDIRASSFSTNDQHVDSGAGLFRSRFINKEEFWSAASGTKQAAVPAPGSSHQEIQKGVKEGPVTKKARLDFRKEMLRNL